MRYDAAAMALNLLVRAAREPLVHFVIAGAILTAAHRLYGKEPARETVVIEPSTLRALRAEHERRTGTPPSPEQERALVADHAESEILYREALALGLDRGDPIVRRRLVEKMRFLAEDLAPIVEPTDAELRAYLDAHADRYATPERLTLSQVFLGETADGADVLRERLEAGLDPAEAGRPFVHGTKITDKTRAQLRQLFGGELGRTVATLPPGRWSGPVRSAYGAHLVFVEKRAPAAPPDLDRLRERVRADWTRDRRDAAAQERLEAIEARYRVVVEGEAQP